MSDTRPTLVIISEDPRVSHRANEALRIALGVVAGENEVTLVLSGPAAHLLDEDTDDLVDGDDIVKYRAALKRLSIPFHVREDAIPTAPGWNADGHTIIRVTSERIAALVTRASRFIIF